ncbi:unnamed protein product [Heligmosomoides polygyrus]|uniref:DNA repair protein REV1 n=1 Tax=Heligmosomoides polygyrus TaxID=6339 RepID=A0A3P8DDY5_HELPZ|nr:unnamed protein product [Heligmosomoides polygyrus]
MYIDCTKVLEQSRIGNPVAFAEHLRAEIKQETGCPASVGIVGTRAATVVEAATLTSCRGAAGRKGLRGLTQFKAALTRNARSCGSVLIARLATRYAKPDGVRWVSPSEAKAFIANEKIRNLPGLGYHTFEKLVKAYGEIERCSELQAIPQSDLERLLGKKIGEQLSRMCRGLDDGKNIVVSNARKSISCDINYGIRFTKKSEVAHFLHVIAQELERKLKQARMVTSSVTLKLMIRSADAPVETAKYLGHGKCDTQNKSASLDHPTGCAQVIAMVILKLFSKLAPVVADIRGIGVQCGRLGLISDVGYSVNSEAITRMFGSRVQKKEMAPEEVERERPQTSRKELPFASSNSPPSFFGESDEARILRDLKKYLHSEASAWEITRGNARVAPHLFRCEKMHPSWKLVTSSTIPSLLTPPLLLDSDADEIDTASDKDDTLPNCGIEPGFDTEDDSGEEGEDDEDSGNDTWTTNLKEMNNLRGPPFSLEW